MYLWRSVLISGGIVAEKRSVCRSSGVLSRIFDTSSMKPMSSMRSASSRTTTSHQTRDMVRSPRKSRTRPGVPTTICEPLRSLRTCPLACTPPTTSATPRFFPAPICSRTPATCWASSLVGVRTRACTATRFVSIRLTIGAPNPIVFPVPVSAFPTTSFPSMMAGYAALLNRGRPFDPEPRKRLDHVGCEPEVGEPFRITCRAMVMIT